MLRKLLQRVNNKKNTVVKIFSRESFHFLHIFENIKIAFEPDDSKEMRHPEFRTYILIPFGQVNFVVKVHCAKQSPDYCVNVTTNNVRMIGNA